ncbi:MAG: MerR family transcriptional regulator [Bryobacterales bacterium]|nr:MerR family transcriptional regulator [Bryobacterales bacterium]
MTITALARQHGLSRATLLYYDRLNLLKPSARLANGYRRYTAKDAARLTQICLYRQTGLPLADIRKLLDKPHKDLAAALERQLSELATQIEALRNRQRIIVELLRNRRLLEKVNIMNRETWVKLLRASGFTDENLHQWHRDFERLDPDHHQRFLEFLCIPSDEIQAIRAWSKQA